MLRAAAASFGCGDRRPTVSVADGGVMAAELTVGGGVPVLGPAVLMQRAGHREAGPSRIITPKAAAGTQPASRPLTPYWTEHVTRQWVGNVPLQGE